MTMKDQGGPAFLVDDCCGMTLRDWFAGQALAGMQASVTEDWPDPEIVAEKAYQCADAMLEERAK